MGFGLNGFGTAQNAMVAELEHDAKITLCSFGAAQTAMVAELARYK